MIRRPDHQTSGGDVTAVEAIDAARRCAGDLADLVEGRGTLLVDASEVVFLARRIQALTGALWAYADELASEPGKAAGR